MPYRVLVDENIDPQTADLLRERGQDAVRIENTLGKGTEDPVVADHARERGYIVLTNDTDFLRPERRQGLKVYRRTERLIDSTGRSPGRDYQPFCPTVYYTVRRMRCELTRLRHLLLI